MLLAQILFIHVQWRDFGLWNFFFLIIIIIILLHIGGWEGQEK